MTDQKKICRRVADIMVEGYAAIERTSDDKTLNATAYALKELVAKLKEVSEDIELERTNCFKPMCPRHGKLNLPKRPEKQVN